MKKLWVIPILLCYLLSAGGVAVSAHFCCGRMASVKISYAAPGCGHDRSGTDKRCCSDVSHFFKLRDAHELTAPDLSLKTPVLRVPLLQDAGLLSSLPSFPLHRSPLPRPCCRPPAALFLQHACLLI
ncbi:HYC_CC_PP family protein [Compostibacter hankyongensis]|uniref:Uncharacterized protein n=1 Tax=Compostibacter hankyongensis TaxID=1007089 RepID=A0ABP8G1B5_9BACT